MFVSFLIFYLLGQVEGSCLSKAAPPEFRPGRYYTIDYLVSLGLFIREISDEQASSPMTSLGICEKGVETVILEDAAMEDDSDGMGSIFSMPKMEPQNSIYVMPNMEPGITYSWIVD